jgi:UDP-glucose 4-epimerase
MNILITGALGHIGSYLLRDLPKKFNNLNIIAVDSLLTQRYCSLFNLPKTANFKFINADITKINLENTLGEIDYVIHLAAVTDASLSFNMKKFVEENNFKSTYAAVNLSVKKNAKLIIMSSTSVYGTKKKTIDENCLETELAPQSPYAEVKLKEENLVKITVKEKQLKSVTLRLGTIFGISPGMRFHTAVNKFCWQAVMKEPITVWKTALEQKRPYLDLLDLGNAIAHIIQKDLFNNKTYNLLSGNFTVNNIIEFIKVYEPQLSIKLIDNNIMNQLSYEVLNQKFINENFQFVGNIQNGIKKTIEQLRQSNTIND